MEPPPYATVTVTVDTVPPVLSFPLVPAMYTRDISGGAVEVCATDAAAVNATVRVSGRPDMGVSLTPLAPCVRSNITADAAYSVVVVGVDAAGNAAAPADVAFVFDRQPPSSTLVLASDSKSGGFVNVTSVSLAANATDALSPWSMEARRRSMLARGCCLLLRPATRCTACTSSAWTSRVTATLTTWV